MGKTTFPYCPYNEKGKQVIDDTGHQSYRSLVTPIIGTITAANIVAVIIASRENWALVACYVERILRLKKRDLEAEEHVGVPS